MAVVTVVTFAVMHTNQVVAVALNRVMTVAALMTAAHAQSAAMASKPATALVMTTVATVTQRHAQQTATPMLAAVRDRLAIAHANLLTALKVIAQPQLRLTVALVTALPLAKNLTHAITLARHVATATVIAVATVTMPTVVTTACWAPVTKAATMPLVPIALLHRKVVIALDRTAVQLVPIRTRVVLVMRMQAAMHRVAHVALHN
jgi:hypothetical protein